MLAVRTWQIDQLQKFVHILGFIVRNTSQADATTYRDGGAGWTVVEVVGHLLDYEDIFLQRFQEMVEKNNPELFNPDPDQLVAAANYNSQDLQDVYQRWTGRRAALLAYLAERSERDWARTGTHPRRGQFTLESWLALTAWHDVNHLEQITHILAERR